MGDVVTIGAFREPLVHGFGVREVVAVGAGRDALVLAGMTVGTGKLTVLGLASGKRCKSRVVAGGTKFRGRTVRVSHHQGHVGLVAGRAVGLGH